MGKKAIFAFKKATKSMGILLVVFLIYSFYDPSFFSSHQIRTGFLALWVGNFLYFFLRENPRDIYDNW